MNLFLDDQPVDADLEVISSLADAVRHVQLDVCPDDRLVVRVRCDDCDVAADQMASTLIRPTSSFARVELFTSTKSGLVVDAMIQADSSLDETLEACRIAGELLSEGNTVDGIQTLGECLHVWQQVHDAVAKSIQLLQLNADEITLNDQSLNDALTKPKEILLQVKQALEVRDLVLLADVLLYDFSEVTDLWHAIINRLRAEAETT